MSFVYSDVRVKRIIVDSKDKEYSELIKMYNDKTLKIDDKDHIHFVIANQIIYLGYSYCWDVHYKFNIKIDNDYEIGIRKVNDDTYEVIILIVEEDGLFNEDMTKMYNRDFISSIYKDKFKENREKKGE